MYIELDACKVCYKKATVSKCLTCNIFKIKSCLLNLTEFIEKHKEELDKYIFYFNKDYYSIIKENINLYNIEGMITSMMLDNQVCVIIDKQELDWGDISYKFIERRDT